MTRLILVFALILTVSLGASLYGQDEVELILEDGVADYEGTRDTTIYSESDNSNGGGQHLFVGQTNKSADRRALIAFDLIDLPEGAQIVSVQLTLTVTRTQSGQTTIIAHRLTTDWGEGEQDAGGQEGAGASATDGDATYAAAISGEVDWDKDGGDFEAEASATRVAEGVGSTLTLEGEGMVADVQAWVDGEADSFGWILIGNGTAKRFHASDGTAEEGLKPRLIIRYTAGS